MLAPGAVVADRFDIERQAGGGGMGAVFRAHDRMSGRPVALKVLTPPPPEWFIGGDGGCD